jgi:hypothetical protein
MTNILADTVTLNLLQSCFGYGVAGTQKQISPLRCEMERKNGYTNSENSVSARLTSHLSPQKRGYAVTAHRSQGKTVDSVIISADVMKQELLYVSASRGREDIAILTSDVNRLGESLGVSMARPSAIELANEIAHSKQQSVDLTPKASIEVPPPQLEISLGHGFELSM